MGKSFKFVSCPGSRHTWVDILRLVIKHMTTLGIYIRRRKNKCQELGLKTEEKNGRKKAMLDDLCSLLGCSCLLENLWSWSYYSCYYSPRFSLLWGSNVLQGISANGYVFSLAPILIDTRYLRALRYWKVCFAGGVEVWDQYRLGRAQRVWWQENVKRELGHLKRLNHLFRLPSVRQLFIFLL